MATPGEQADGFVNNWAYLKTELQWLERVLLLAVARQRKDIKEIDRLSQTGADRATSHWWKGVIALEGNIAYDEHRQPQSGNRSTYQQQLEAQIQASQRKGIVLGLPALRDRLRLSEFEKNLVLMALAPEVNRRYAQLYRFLQGSEDAGKPDLPTLDLILRLLCRTDADWYTTRSHFLTTSSLLKADLLQLLPCPEQTRLSSPIKLSDRLVNYLLSDQPTPAALDALLHPPAVKAPAAPVAVISRCVYLQRKTTPVAWSDVILPPDCLSPLQYLSQQVAGQLQAEDTWNLSGEELRQTGQLVLLAGKPGTGKTTAAAAIASALDVPLFTLDLARIDPANYPAALKEISLHVPTVVLIKSAQQWLSRSSTLPKATLQQFFQERSKLATVTCFSVVHSASVQLQWQRQMNCCLTLPVPAAIERLKLWQRAFPASVAVSEQMPWPLLADQLRISGGTIGEIVQETLCYAAAMGSSTVEPVHLQTVCQQRGYRLDLPAALLKPKAKRKSTRKPSASPAPTAAEPLPEALTALSAETLSDLSPTISPRSIPEAEKSSPATKRRRSKKS